MTRAQLLHLVFFVAVAACSKRGGNSEGVIVRQVLHGADVLQDTAPEAQADTGPKVLQPGQVTTTLVTDTPQAAYKQALDAARRKLDTDGLRQALSQLESQIEQEQESPP